MSSPDLLSLAEQFARASAKKDAAALARIVQAYGSMYARLAGQIEALAEQIGAEQMTTGQLARMTRFKSLMAQIEDELVGMQYYTRTELSAGAQAAVTRALNDSRSLVSLSASGAGVTAGFNSLPADAVIRLLGFLANDSPLYKRLRVLAPYHSEAIRQLFVDGVGLGWNPRKIAAQIRKQFGMVLTDALRMTRTAQLYAYREATRANYVANENTVSGWIWFAALDDRTCMSCVRMHGTVHTNQERLNDHHNGRCAMLPLVRGYGNPIKQTGEQWFETISEADQKRMMGAEYHSAWKQGYYQFGDLSRQTDNEVYGPMRTVTPLWDLLGAEPPLRTR